jgi:hydrogenase 3 maturation protease
VQNLETILKNKLQNARRVAVLGIGSELRGDDIAGLLAAQQIEKTIAKQTTSPEVRVFIGETAPENLTGEIKRFKPTHLIIIDAADLNKEPGHIEIMEPEAIGGTSFCTHSLPIKVMTDYLLQSFYCQVITIGIQPKTLTFGSQPTKEVVAAAKHLAEEIAALFKKAK